MLLLESADLSLKQRVSASRSFHGDIDRSFEASRASFGIGQVNVPVLGTQKSGASGGTGVTHDHVRRNGGTVISQLLGNDRANGRVLSRAGWGTADMHTVGCSRMLVNHVMVQTPDDDATIEPSRQSRKVFTDLHAFDCRINSRVMGTGPFSTLLRISERFGIEGVDVTRTAS